MSAPNSAPTTAVTTPPNEPSVLQSLSPVVLKYLHSLSTGQRHLSSSQLAELSSSQYQDRFLEYMRSACSNVVGPIPHIDLTYPISNYFINSSHNTYLEGNQLSSVSSTDAYKNVRSSPFNSLMVVKGSHGSLEIKFEDQGRECAASDE